MFFFSDKTLAKLLARDNGRAELFLLQYTHKKARLFREKVKGYENIPPNLREPIRFFGARGMLLLPTVGTETALDS